MKWFSFLVLLSIFSISKLNALWEQCNGKPLEGRVNGALINENVIYACTDKGISVSSDEGKSWDLKNNGLTYTNVYTIAIRDDKIFAGTWGGGIFVSSDDGNNWTKSNENLTNLYIYTIEFDTNSIYAGTKDGVFLSNDDGKFWTNVGLSKESVYSITLKNKLIFAGTDGSGVYISENKGISWSGINEGLTDLSVYSLRGHKDLLLAGTGGGVFISTDDGKTWKEKNNGLTNLNVMSVVSTGDSIFAGSLGGGIFVSTDKGESWIEKNIGLEDLYIEKLKINEKSIFAISKQGKIYYSVNYGEYWIDEINRNTKIASAMSLICHENYVVAGAYGNSLVYISTNNGTSWSSVRLDNKSLFVSELMELNGYLFAGTSAGVYRSKNMGLTWENKCQELNKGKMDEIYGLISHGGNVFVGKTSDGIYKSSNYGDNWIKTSTGLPTENMRCMLSYDNMVFAGVTGNGVYKSTDNGESWIGKNNGLDRQIFCLAETMKHIIAGTSYGGLFISTDYGESWTKSSNGITSNLIYSLATNNTNIFVGTSIGIFLSNDLGKNWIDISDELSGYQKQNFYAVALNDSFIFISNTKGYVFKRRLTELPVSVYHETYNVKDFKLDIFPNPLQSISTIKITIPNNKGNTNKSLVLYDLLGRKVRNFDSDTDGIAGQEISINWDGTDSKGIELPNGVYMMVLQIGNKRTSMKVIIAR